MSVEDIARKESIAYFRDEELPASAFVDKYALRDGAETLLETNPDQMHRRMARELSRIEKSKFKKPYDEEFFYNLFKDFGCIVPQGGPMYGIGNSQYVSLGNCFVVNTPADSFGGVHQTDEQLSQISKRRGGVGLDVSRLRPAGTPTSNSARTSTGVVPFCERFSNSIREVGQNGRRGALMLTISVHHPEILNFTRMKLDPKCVTGANVSVRLSDEFLAAVTAGTTYEQRWPCEGAEPQVRTQVDARSVWQEIVRCAWLRAEPGILFWDSILKDSPADCYADQGFQTVSTNPCVAADTWTLTAEGPRQVRDLVDKPFIAIVDGKPYDAPRGFWSTGIQEVYEVLTSAGHRVVCTGNHQFKKPVNKTHEWVETNQLKIGQRVFLNDHDTTLVWTGAGTLHDGACVGRVVASTGFNHRRDDEELALRFGVKVSKELDTRTEQTSSDFYIGFIGAWFDECCRVIRNRKTVVLETSSFRLNNLRALQRMLARLGIYSEIRASEAEACTVITLNNARQSFGPVVHLRITGGSVARFMERIGIRNTIALTSLQSALSESGIKKHCSQTQARIKSVRLLGSEEVFDCEVADVHEFDGNGFSLHNCGEIPLCELDSCRLLVVNLFCFVRQPFTKEAWFDYADFAKHGGHAQRIQDDIIDLELESVKRILKKIDADPEPADIKRVEKQMWLDVEKKCCLGRRTGTGITALGDTLAALGIAYGSDESIAVTEQIYRTLKLACYRASVDMARELGPFPLYDAAREANNPFLLRLRDDDPALYADMLQYGRRHIALLTTAPTGTTSLVAGPAPYFGRTSGIEPLFTDVPYTRRKKINPSDKQARVDFVDALGDKWQHFDVFHSGSRMWMDITGEKDWQKSPYRGCCAQDIDWQQRVRLQAAAQKHLDHSVSSTQNLPHNVSQEEVARIYETAWKSGCKGITVYRDGCRDGVLIAKTVKKADAPKRPLLLPCEIFRFSVRKEPFVVVVGLLEGVPYEVFGFSNSVETSCVLLKVPANGFIQKVGRGQYDLLDAARNSLMVGCDSLSKRLDNEQEALTRMVSTSLRHGVPLSFLVHQLEKTKGDLTSFSKAIARALKKYVVDGTTVSGEICQSCGQEGSLRRQEGCVTCIACSWTKC